MSSKEGQLMLREKIKKIVEKLNFILLQQSFEQFFKFYKEICLNLVFFLRMGKIGLLKHSELQNGLRSCMNSLKIVLQSTQYQKYSHRFPLIHKLLRSYQLSTLKKLQPAEKEKVIELMHKSQRFPYFCVLGSHGISSQQIKFLKSDRIQCFLQDLAKQQIVLQNPQCVCCSPVFIKDFKILNNNPLISVVVQLSEKKGFDQIIFESYVNAVCNKKGGVIIIGAERKNENEIALGVRFNSMQEIIKKQTEIQMTIFRIKPICQYLIQRVLVHTNYISPRKIGQENMRICFRILLFPYQPEKVAYNEILNKGYHRIYEVFKFDYLKKPYKVTSAINSEPEEFESLYTMIHEKYRQSRKIVNSHQNIGCVRPHPHYSKIFQKYVQEGCSAQTDVDIVEQKIKQPVIYEDQPKMKYQHKSLLILGSAKDDRFIQQLRKCLIERKLVFQITKPFSNSFQDVGRSIWLISHEINFILLRSIQKNLQSLKILPPKSLIMMPVYSTLEVQKLQYNSNRQYIQRKFFSRYEHLYQTEAGQTLDQKKKAKKVTYLHFNQYNEAVFAYMTFEQIQIKPYFTKDGNNPSNKKYSKL